MDPLSIAASVAGLLAAGSKMTGLLGKISALRDAPSSAELVLDEMTAMSAALTELQQYIDGEINIPAESRRFISLENLVVTLTGSVATYSELEGIIDAAHVGRMKVFDRVRWVRKEETIQDIIGRMQNQKASMTLMLSVLHSTSQRGMQSLMIQHFNIMQDALRAHQELLDRLVLNRIEGEARRASTATEPGPRSELEFAPSENQTAALANWREDTYQSVEPKQGEPSRSSRFASRLIPARFPVQRTMVAESLKEVLQSSPAYQRSDRRRTITEENTTGDNASIVSTQSLADVLNIPDVSLPLLRTDIDNATWYSGPEQEHSLRQEVFEVSVKSLTCLIYNLTVWSDMTGLQLKEMLYQKTGLPPYDQYLVVDYNKRWIPEDVTDLRKQYTCDAPDLA